MIIDIDVQRGNEDWGTPANVVELEQCEICWALVHPGVIERHQAWHERIGDAS